MDYIRQTHHNPVYSDEPLAVYILTDKNTYQVPFVSIEKNNITPGNYQEYDFMRDRLLESDGILVLFDAQCSNPNDEWTRVLTRDLRLIEEIAGTCIYSP